MKNNSYSLVWFRNDLRTYDNPALHHACANSKKLICLYVLEEDDPSDFSIGSASKWWLHHSLIDLASSLEKIGLNLFITKGTSEKIINKICKEHQISKVYWNRRYEPYNIKKDSSIKDSLSKIEIEVISCKGNVLIEPWKIENSSGKPYQVFTPFWKSMRNKINIDEILPTPKKTTEPYIQLNNFRNYKVYELNLLPRIKWDEGLYNKWKVGERRAKKMLDDFIKNNINEYNNDRNYPSLSATSELSPYLHFGQISVRYVYKTVSDSFKNKSVTTVEPYLRQLGWRDFAVHLLFHFPHTINKPLKKEFETFPWNKSKKALKKWQQGQTGIPIVDAGMRELWETGIMHNRLRMIVGSFLVKNLRIHWLEGARWFWDTLVDADLANNTLGWQWVAGSGADAAPYFRIFNPVLQSERFDPEGKYIRTWVPEISKLENKYIFKPWECSESILKDANIKLGKTYPHPICDLKETRDEALEAYESIKKR